MRVQLKKFGFKQLNGKSEAHLIKFQLTEGKLLLIKLFFFFGKQAAGNVTIYITVLILTKLCNASIIFQVI
jgi:hypothetical protein